MHNNVIFNSVAWVPKGLIITVAQKRIYKAFHLFILLKYNSSSIIRPERNFTSNLARYYNVSPNTIRNWLDKLLKVDWIGYDKKTGVYYIRGYYTICQKMKIQDRTRVPYQLASQFDIRGFIGGVLFTIALNHNRKRFRDRAVSQNGNTFQPTRASSLLFATAATSSCSLFFNVPNSTMKLLKKLAIKDGYLRVTESNRCLKVEIKGVVQANKYGIDLGGTFFNKKGNTYQKLPDKLTTTLVIRRVGPNR